MTVKILYVDFYQNLSKTRETQMSMGNIDQYVDNVIKKALDDIDILLQTNGIQGEIKQTDKYSVLLTFLAGGVSQNFSVSITLEAGFPEVRVHYTDFTKGDPGNISANQRTILKNDEGKTEFTLIVDQDIIDFFNKIYGALI